MSVNTSEGNIQSVAIVKAKELFRRTETGIFLVLLVLCVFMAIVNPVFMSPFNMGVMLRQFSFIAIVAFGQTLVLLSGGIDLSVGSVGGLCAVIAGWLFVNLGVPPALCIAIGLAMGFSCGALSGIVISRMKISPFIVTLAMGEICAGFILVVTRGWAITGLPDSMIYLGQGIIFSIPLPVIIMVVIAVILAYVLKKLPFGRYVYAIGGNESAALLVGVKVKKVKVLVFGFSGMLAALSGILLMGRLASAQPTIGAGWVMPSVTAAIIGGTSLSGGEGGVVGTLIGAALMGVLTSAIVLLGISAYWERVIIGAVVLTAVLIDRMRQIAHQRRV